MSEFAKYFIEERFLVDNTNICLSGGGGIRTQCLSTTCHSIGSRIGSNAFV